MKLIIWLWNPWKKYEHTRHNVGYMMVDMLRKPWNFDDWQESRFQAVIREWIYDGEKIVLIKPMTFMNLSWDAVVNIVNFYKLDPKTDILVLSDDIDMDFAKVRHRAKGSHGGQNGLWDIIAKLGTDEFSRIKIGIGRHEQYSVSDWVLSKFTKQERNKLDEEIFLQVEVYIKKWLWDSI